MVNNPPKEEVIVALLKVTRQPTRHMLKKVTGIPSREPRELDPMVLEVPLKDEGIQVEFRVIARRWLTGSMARRSEGR